VNEDKLNFEFYKVRKINPKNIKDHF